MPENIPPEQVPLWKRKDFIFGMALALLIWGLQLIGVTVNAWLGAAVLAFAFALVARSFWAWEGPSRWHIAWRGLTVLIAAGLYAAIIIPQIKTEWAKEHPSVKAALQQPETKPAETKTEEKKPQQKAGKKSKPNINVQQNSSGPSSPNIAQVGNNNQATITVQPKRLVLSAEQQALITSKIKSYSGATVHVFVHGPTPETSAFANQFCRAMEDAGLTVSQSRGYFQGVEWNSGVNFSFAPDSEKLASALAEALVEGKVVDPPISRFHLPDGAFRIVITQP